jgi:YfiH family protein
MILYTSKLFAQHGLVVGTTDKSLNFNRRHTDFLASLDKITSYYSLSTKDYVAVKQIHSTIVIDETEIVEDTEVDGIISQSKNKLIGIKTADCVPVIFYDLKNKVAVAVHAGRKGIRDGIIDKTLEILKKRYNTNFHDMIAYIGPNIAYKDHLVFEKELEGFENKYYEKLPKGQHVINNRRKYEDFKLSNNLTDEDLNEYTSAYLDLKQVVLDKLYNAGVLSENIDDCNINSFEEQNTHSYRRDYPENGLSLTYFLNSVI